jgi:hypothetical protein
MLRKNRMPIDIRGEVARYYNLNPEPLNDIPWRNDFHNLGSDSHLTKRYQKSLMNLA